MFRFLGFTTRNNIDLRVCEDTDFLKICFCWFFYEAKKNAVGTAFIRISLELHNFKAEIKL